MDAERITAEATMMITIIIDEEGELSFELSAGIVPPLTEVNESGGGCV